MFYVVLRGHRIAIYYSRQVFDFSEAHYLTTDCSNEADRSLQASQNSLFRKYYSFLKFHDAFRCMLTWGAQYEGYTTMGQRVHTLNDQFEEVLRPRTPPQHHPSPISSLTYTSVSEGHQEHTPSPDRAFLATQSPWKQRELTPSPEKASSPAKLVWELSPSPKKEQAPTLPPFHSASSKSRQPAPAPVKHNSPNPEKLAPTLRSSPSTPSRSLSQSCSAILSPGHTQITVHVNPLVEISGIVGKYHCIGLLVVLITHSFIVVIICLPSPQFWYRPVPSAIASL